MDIEKLKDELTRDEGLRKNVYKCTAGKLTIGVGRNLEDNGLSEDEIALMLENDIRNCEKQLFAYIPVFKFLNEVRQRVLLNMCFNMGIGTLRRFKRMVAALEKRDYAAAKREMLDSRWARQVGSRSARLARQMEDGE